MNTTWQQVMAGLLWAVYSGWIYLEDGRRLVLNYTDDTARSNCTDDTGFGVPWIRGTYLLPGDLPPARRK